MDQFLQDLRPFLQAVLVASTGVYAFGVLWFAGGMRRSPRLRGGEPSVSVVLAARDEEASIGLCLGDLLAQTYPRHAYEVVVVDDGSSDGTAEVVAKVAESGAAVRLLHGADGAGGAGSKKAALSLGVRSARGEIILTTDADCRLPPTWVRSMVDCFGPDVGMVAGFSQVGNPGEVQGVRQGWEAVDFLCLMASAAGSAGHGHPMGASGQNLAYRKLAFDGVGGFRRVRHRASGDDVLLLHLIRRLTSWRVEFAAEPGATVVHPFSSSWRELLSRRARWASNAPYQFLMDPLFFAYLLSAFGSSLLLAAMCVLVPAMGWSPAVLVAAWGVRALAEGILCGRACHFLRRPDLLRYYPLWVLSQPFYTVLIGLAGMLGRFDWKGKRHRWGRSA